jgi:Spx/MgsR family transcriptional regulator
MAQPIIQCKVFYLHTAVIVYQAWPLSTTFMNQPQITVYGIANCDSVKKTRAWMTEHELTYAWHDFKKEGMPTARMSIWLEKLQHTRIVNRQGTTWRKLSADEQAQVTDNATALALLQEHHSIVKRPIVEWVAGHSIYVSAGFAPELWQSWREKASNLPSPIDI